MRHCVSCARPLSKRTGVGRPAEHCATERCERIHRRAWRIKSNGCPRCGLPLARGKQAKRNGICGTCFVDLTDLVALMGTQPVRREA